MRGLGDDTIVPPEFLSPSQDYDPAGAAVESPIIPGSSLSDIIFNMRTGNVSQAQDNALVNQETASLVQAGMDPQTAASTADSDVTTTLDTFTGPGGLGISWTGAGPNSPTFTDAAISSLFPNGLLPPGFSIPTWVWVVGGVLGGFWLLKEFRVIK
jgi:hypothetical protein